MNTSKGKKVARLQLRIAPETWNRFRKSCANVDRPMSVIIRDLIEAVIPYIVKCGGRWYPPKVVVDVPPQDQMSETERRKEESTCA